MANIHILKLGGSKKLGFFVCFFFLCLLDQTKTSFGTISPFLLSLNIPYQATGAEHFLVPSSVHVSCSRDSGQKHSFFGHTSFFFLTFHTPNVPQPSPG